MSEWTQRMRDWVAKADSDSLLNLAISIDAHAVAGNKALFKTSRNWLLRELQQQQRFLTSFAEVALVFETPLNFMGGIRDRAAGIDVTHARAARCDGARSLARSRACGAAVVMVVWRSVTPRVTRITRSAHHARARARHQRAIRASLPFPSPRAHARLRCSGSGARSLPRLRARGVAGNAILGAFRCRSPPSHPTHPPDNPLQTAPFLIARYDDARAKPTHARALRRRRRSLARSIARARVAVAVEVAVGYTARHARYARRASRARTRTSSPRIARVITVSRPPRARPARARCSGGGARSLARLRARGVAVVMVMAGGGRLHRTSRA